MPQVKKDEVEERIREGALRTFAVAGWEGATMSDVARAAGVSTGNLYRYFASKEELFEAVVGADFVASFRGLLRARVRSLAAGPANAYAEAVAALLDFAIAHRLRVVILLGRAKGSRHEEVASEVVQELVELAEAHFRERGEHGVLSPPRRFVLRRIYESLVETTVAILAEHEDPRAIREATAAFDAYHLTGMRAFFAPGDQASRSDQRK